jgi:DNA-binding transcriptional MerR regulator
MSETIDTTEDLDPLDIEEQQAMAKLFDQFGMTGDDNNGQGTGPGNTDSSVYDNLTDTMAGNADSHQSQNNTEAKRLADTQRAYHESRAEASALREQLNQQGAEIAQLRQLLEQRQTSTSAQGQDDNLPDLDSATEEFDLEPVVKHVKRDQARLDRLEQTLAQQQRQEAERRQMTELERHTQAILSKHPDATNLVNDQRFNEWVAKQPPALKNIVTQGDAESINWLLDSFKQAAGMGQKPNHKAASVPNLRGMSPALRQPDSATGKIPLSSLNGMSAGEIATRYPDDSIIDYAA